MLYNATGFEKIYLAYGYTDIRRGIDGLANVVENNFNLDPFQKNCQRRFNFDPKRRTEMTHIAGHSTAGISAGGTV